ncbi:hypothetical protein CKF43_11235 [Pantoea graminicola]|nr:hypothetical protein CKF43_11235 [Pantoea sp. ARC607]
MSQPVQKNCQKLKTVLWLRYVDTLMESLQAQNLLAKRLTQLSQTRMALIYFLMKPQLNE